MKPKLKPARAIAEPAPENAGELEAKPIELPEHSPFRDGEAVDETSINIAIRSDKVLQQVTLTQNHILNNFQCIFDDGSYIPSPSDLPLIAGCRDRDVIPVLPVVSYPDKEPNKGYSKQLVLCWVPIPIATGNSDAMEEIIRQRHWFRLFKTIPRGDRIFLCEITLIASSQAFAKQQVKAYCSEHSLVKQEETLEIIPLYDQGKAYRVRIEMPAEGYDLANSSEYGFRAKDDQEATELVESMWPDEKYGTFSVDVLQD